MGKVAVLMDRLPKLDVERRSNECSDERVEAVGGELCRCSEDEAGGERSLRMEPMRGEDSTRLEVLVRSGVALVPVRYGEAGCCPRTLLMGREEIELTML